MPRSIALALVVAAAIGCAPASRGPGIDVDRTMAEGESLAFPRPRDTDASSHARTLIEEVLRAMDVSYEEIETGTVELPPIQVMGVRYRNGGPITVRDASVVARFGPPGKALLVMAHYDSVPNSPGACDNAAAVAILLELARVLKAEPPDRPVIVAFTAAEEVGLVGAEALAARFGDDIELAIALDLVGGDGPLVVNGASTLIGETELAWLRDAADRAGVDLSFPLAHRVISRWWPQAERSDHGPFTRRGVRAIHFYNRGNDGEWIDLAYHSARDTWPRVHREHVAEVGRLLRALIAAPVPPHDGDGFVVPVAHVVMPRWLLVALELAFAMITIVVLARQKRARSPGAGLVLGLACYVVALVVAIGLERGVTAYPGAYLLSPLRHAIAMTLVFAGLFGLLTRAVARVKPWTGAIRYRAFASMTCLAIGIMLVAAGAAELAWIWLVPALVIAIAPAPVGVVASALPLVLVLVPAQVREAAWNGFWPPALPIVVAIALLAAPMIAAAAFAWSSRPRQPGPLGTLVLGVGCGLAVCLGFLMLNVGKTTCMPAEFEQFGLSCERV